MKKLKPVMLALGPIVLIAGLWWWVKANPNPIPDAVTFVNILTGETKQVRQADVESIPMRAPDGKAVLYPAFKAKDGSWEIDSHFKGPLYDSLKANEFTEKDLKVDLKTNKVQVK